MGAGAEDEESVSRRANILGRSSGLLPSTLGNVAQGVALLPRLPLFPSVSQKETFLLELLLCCGRCWLSAIIYFLALGFPQGERPLPLGPVVGMAPK